MVPDGRFCYQMAPWSFQKKTMYVTIYRMYPYPEESLSNVCTQGKLSTSEYHQNTRQIRDQTRAGLKTVIQWYIIVTLGKGVEDWMHLGTNTGLFHHRSMRHIIHKATSRHSDLISRTSSVTPACCISWIAWWYLVSNSRFLESLWLKWFKRALACRSLSSSLGLTDSSFHGRATEYRPATNWIFSQKSLITWSSNCDSWPTIPTLS